MTRKSSTLTAAALRKPFALCATALVFALLWLSCAGGAATREPAQGSAGIGVASPAARLNGFLDAQALAAQPNKDGLSFARGHGWAIAGASDLSTLVVAQAHVPFAKAGKILMTSSFVSVLMKDKEGYKDVGDLSLGWLDIEHGAALAVSPEGEFLLTGAPAREKKAGAIYLYGKKNGAFQANADGKVEPLFGLFGQRAGDSWGSSVSLSSGGQTVVWGESGAGGGGKVQYLIKPEKGWLGVENLIGGYLGARSSQGAEFGRAVAISADDSTIVIGAPGENKGAGAAYCFIRPKGGWTKTTTMSVITPSKLDPGSRFGERVAVSADGRVVAISAPGAKGGAGAITIFQFADDPLAVADSSKRDFEAIELASRDGDRAAGTSLALSADGKSLVYGCLDEKDAGSIVYRQSNGSWSKATDPQGMAMTKPTPSDFFGFGLAISAGGERILFTAPGSNGGEGMWDWIDVNPSKK